MRGVPGLVLALVLTGCAAGVGDAPASPAPSPRPTAGPASPGTPPAPRRLGPADDGRAFTLRVGQTTAWRETDAAAPAPTASGRAVLVIEVVNVQGGGGREWEVRGAEPGTAVLRTPTASVTLVVTP